MHKEKQAEGGGEAKVGEVLVESGKVSQKDLDSALEKQNQPPEKPKLGEPYSFLHFARSLNLDGPEDWSARIDDYLYGHLRHD